MGAGSTESDKSLSKWFSNRSSTKPKETKEEVVVPVNTEKKDDHPKPVGIFTLFRYATRIEIALNLVGLLLAIGAGSAQPLMTLFFGNITKSFTEFGMAIQQIESGSAGADVYQALEDARRRVKSDAGRMALWITVIGA